MSNNENTNTTNEIRKELTINIVDKNITYTKMLDILGYVVESSKSISDNRIHKINGDYMFAGTVLSMFTDYEIGDDPNRDEIMEIFYSDKWGELTDKIGRKYDVFKSYYDAEVELVNAPLTNVNDTVVKIGQLIENVNNIVKAIDVDKLQGADVMGMISAINKYADEIQNTKADDAGNNITEFPSK